MAREDDPGGSARNPGRDRVERARAQALLSLVSDAGIDVPLLRPATLADIDAVAALHQRCSAGTLYHRYQVPLRMPMTTRMARRLVMPDSGTAVVVQTGLDLVGHGIIEQVADRWTFQLLVEDAWQGRGLGAMLVKQAAGRAKALGAERLTFVTAGSNDKLLRHITVPLSKVLPIED